LLLVTGCATQSTDRSAGGQAARFSAVGPLAVGLVWMASEAAYLEPDYLAAALVTYGLYDPLSPTWSVKVTLQDEGRVRVDLAMKKLATGGEGEARKVFLRQARELVVAGGFADFEVLH